MKPQDVQFKHTNNVAEVMRLELGGGEVLVIRGEPDMAAYEWLLVADGEVVSHSNDGFGWRLAAMREGLVAYTEGT
jgi:hypothetical protein